MTTGRLIGESVVQLKAEGKPCTDANLKVYRDKLADSFVMKDLKKYKDMPALLHANSQNYFLAYPQLVSKAMENFLRVDGTPKLDKEKATIRSFVKERSWTGLFGDAWKLARAWR
jgi:electron transfer flavoprotein-quinone oxidoreductase